VPDAQKAPIGNGAHESGKIGPALERFAPGEARGWGDAPHLKRAAGANSLTHFRNMGEGSGRRLWKTDRLPAFTSYEEQVTCLRMLAPVPKGQIGGVKVSFHELWCRGAICLPTSEPPDDRRIWLTSPDSRVSSDRRLIRHGSLPSPISRLPLRITAVSEPGGDRTASNRRRPDRPTAMHTSRAVPVRRACDAATLPNLHRQAHPLPSPTSLARARGQRSSTELARQSWCCESRQTLTRRW